MNWKGCGTRWHLSLAMGFALSFLGARPGLALSYSSGDVVGIFVNAGLELEVDLGALSGLANGKTFTFGTPSAWAGTGAIGQGSIFTAFETHMPFSGTMRTIAFTTDTCSPAMPGTACTPPNPPSFDNMLAPYVAKIPAAQSALDTGSVGGSPDWLQNLNNFGNANGTSILINDAQRLSILTSNPSSYTTVIGTNGQNNINGNLPFATSVQTFGNGQGADLWSATRTGLTTSKTTLLGTFTVNGNATGDGSEVSITFHSAVVPEPGTMVLLSMGLLGLAWTGRRRYTD